MVEAFLFNSGQRQICFSCIRFVIGLCGDGEREPWRVGDN